MIFFLLQNIYDNSILQKSIEITYMFKPHRMQSKEFFNFSKHSKNSSNIQPIVSAQLQTQNQQNFKHGQYQQMKQFSNKKIKQRQHTPTPPVRGHRRVISMFTSEKQKQMKFQRLLIKQKSPLENKNQLYQDQSPTFSFIQSSKKMQRKYQTKQAIEVNRDFSIFPLSFQKKNFKQQAYQHSVKNESIDRLQLINEIIFFKGKLDTEIMKNKELSNTYQQFLDQNYQLKQLNLNHPNWYIYQENQQLKQKLRLLQQFSYPTSRPQTPEPLKMQVNGMLQMISQYEPNHNSPIRLLYPFQ